MSTKDVLLELAATLPPNATISDAIAELEQHGEPKSAEQITAELEDWRRSRASGAEIESPAWQGAIIADRLAKYEAGECELLSLEDIAARKRLGQE